MPRASDLTVQSVMTVRPMVIGVIAGVVLANAGLVKGQAVQPDVVIPQPPEPQRPLVPVVLPPVQPVAPIVIMPPAPRRPRPNVQQAVVLDAVNADVEITDQVSVTRATYTLRNVTSSPSEAQLLIPVPEGVVIRSFQYDGTGPEPTAVLLPKDEARRQYDAIVHATRDPGLLEFAGYNAIRSSVFPVPANSAQSVRITYEQMLPATGDRFDYVLPRSESNRTDGTRWSLKFSIKSKKEINNVFSASHAIASQRTSPGEFTGTIEPAAFNQPGSVVLSVMLRPARPEVPSATIMAMPDLTLPGGQGGYFLMVIAMPPAPSVPDSAKPKREVTIVLDRSGSMNGEKIVQAKAAAMQVLSGLRDGESFNIIDYASEVTPFSSAAMVKDASSFAKARDYLAAIRAEGGTALHAAALEALKPNPTAGTLPIVLFLTDGQPTVGERAEATIRADVMNANAFSRRIFTFGVGFDVNSPLLSGIAKSSRGMPTYILPNENVEERVSQVFRYLAGPMYTSPSITMSSEAPAGAARISAVQPAVLDDVYDGEQIVIVGRYDKPGEMRLRLTGRAMNTGAQQDKSFEIIVNNADPSARNGFVGRLWAQKTINAMIDEIRQSAAGKTEQQVRDDPRNKELVNEVIRLSKAFGILTEYTAFLATEARDERGRHMSNAWQADRGRDDMVRRIAGDRSGAGGVNQEANTAERSKSMSVGASPAAARPNALQQVDAKKAAYYDENMNLREVKNLQAVNDRAFALRNNRWIDLRMLDAEEQAPEVTIEFGTPEWSAAADELIRANLQGVLTLDAPVYLMLNGKRTLVKME